jgi:hypothetical protein
VRVAGSALPDQKNVHRDFRGDGSRSSAQGHAEVCTLDQLKTGIQGYIRTTNGYGNKKSVSRISFQHIPSIQQS